MKATPVVNSFLEQYPSAKITTSLISQGAIVAQLEEIKKDCEDFQAGNYYKTIINDEASGTKLTVWIDANDYKIICVVKEGNGQKTELPASKPLEAPTTIQTTTTTIPAATTTFQATPAATMIVGATNTSCSVTSKGTVTDQDGKNYTNICIDKFTLKAYHCYNNEVISDPIITCLGSFCENGKCVAPPPKYRNDCPSSRAIYGSATIGYDSPISVGIIDDLDNNKNHLIELLSISPIKIKVDGNEYMLRGEPGLGEPIKDKDDYGTFHLSVNSIDASKNTLTLGIVTDYRCDSRKCQTSEISLSPNQDSVVNIGSAVHTITLREISSSTDVWINVDGSVTKYTKGTTTKTLGGTWILVKNVFKDQNKADILVLGSCLVETCFDEAPNTIYKNGIVFDRNVNGSFAYKGDQCADGVFHDRYCVNEGIVAIRNVTCYYGCDGVVCKTPPILTIASSIQNNSKNIDINTDINLFFSEPIDKSTFKLTVSPYPPSGRTQSSIQPDMKSGTIFFEDYSNTTLDYSTNYKISISKVLTSAGGGSLSDDYNLFFTTKDIK